MTDLVVQYDDMLNVVGLLLKGNNPTAISKELGISRVRVLDHIDNWKKWANQEQDIVSRARETLSMVDKHYELLIKESWNTIEQADAANNLAVKATMIKIVAALEKDRAQLFQSAGLSDTSALAEQMQETERKQEVLAGILRDVVSKCDHCRIEVKHRLSDYSGTVEVIEVRETQ